MKLDIAPATNSLMSDVYLDGKGIRRWRATGMPVEGDKDMFRRGAARAAIAAFMSTAGAYKDVYGIDLFTEAERELVLGHLKSLAK